MPKNTFFNISEDKRKRIIEAALSEFTNYPYEEVLISRISKRSDIPVGSFYQYFHDKDDLYLYIFFDLDLKIIHLCEKYGISYFELCDHPELLVSSEVTQEEMDFYDTWNSVPDEVIRKYYFGEYDDKIFDLCRQTISDYQKQGLLNDKLDVEFILFFYVTATFNIYMYCKKYNITDLREKVDLKIRYFDELIHHGILKK